jgi:hypothetical protein
MFIRVNSLRASRRFTPIASLGFVAPIWAALFSVALISAPAHSQTPSQPPAQTPDEATIIRGVDAAVHHRVDSIAGYTVNESYKLFRGSDLTHPAAEMTIRTTYARETGKSYKILSEDGSHILRSAVFSPLLDDEKRIKTFPAMSKRPGSSPPTTKCTFSPAARNSSTATPATRSPFTQSRGPPNLIEGTIWVDVSR